MRIYELTPGGYDPRRKSKNNVRKTRRELLRR